MEIGTSGSASLLQLYRVQSRSLSEMDQNGDNSLDLGEIEAALTGKNDPAKSAGQAKSTASQTFKALDADGDGKLDASELKRNEESTAQAMQLTLAQLAGNLVKSWWQRSSTSSSDDSAFADLTGNGARQSPTATTAVAPSERVGSIVDRMLNGYRQWQSARQQPGETTDLAA